MKILFLLLLSLTSINTKSTTARSDKSGPFLVILFDSRVFNGAGHLALALYNPDAAEAWYFSFNKEGYKEKRKAVSLIEMQANLSRYDGQLHLKISPSEYNAMLNKANAFFNNNYDLDSNNCGHFVLNVVCDYLICGSNIYTYTGIPFKVYNNLLELNWTRVP
jgi:hypothetical protein